MLFACNNATLESENADKTVSISNTDQLEFLLSTAIPIEGGYSIEQQARNFSTSEIQYQEKGIFYIYKPKKGFTGEDLVKIKREDSNGAEIVSRNNYHLKN